MLKANTRGDIGLKGRKRDKVGRSGVVQRDVRCEVVVWYIQRQKYIGGGGTGDGSHKSEAFPTIPAPSEATESTYCKYLRSKVRSRADQ